MIDPDKTTIQDELSFANVKTHGPVATQRFLEMIQKGETVKIAEMLATRKAPSLGINDQTYFANKRGSLLDQFNGSEAVLNHWNTEYRKRTGEDIPKGAVIFRSLAAGVGDPDAVLSHKQSLSEIKAKMKIRNIRIEGDWEQVPVAAPPKPQLVRMGADLVEKYVDDYIAENPDLQQTDRNELREMVVDKHSRKVTADDLNPSGATDFRTLAQKMYREHLQKPAIKIDTAPQPAGRGKRKTAAKAGKS